MFNRFKYLKIFFLIVSLVSLILIILLLIFYHYYPNDFIDPHDKYSIKSDSYLADTDRFVISKRKEIISKRPSAIYSLNIVFIMSLCGFCVCLLDLDSRSITNCVNEIGKIID